MASRGEHAFPGDRPVCETPNKKKGPLASVSPGTDRGTLDRGSAASGAQPRVATPCRADRPARGGTRWLHPTGGVGRRTSSKCSSRLFRMSSIQYQPGSTEESHLEQENLSKSDTIAILLVPYVKERGTRFL